MRKADEILKDLKEAQYQVYNKQEETEEGLTPENRRNYSSEDLRNIFIGTIYGETNSNTIDFLRSAINKMPDEWVLEFLKVVNGDTVEKVNEDFNVDRFNDRAKDAINALNDVIGYLKEGIGKRVDKADIETLEYSTVILDDCMN